MTVTNISVIHGVAGVAGPMGPPGAGYDATSSSAFIVGLGGKTFIVPADLAYLPGTRVHFASTANPSLNWMEGFVVNYTDVNLYVTIDLISSTADGNPHLDWSVSLTGQPGTQGARGINGAAGVSGNRIWYGTAAPNGITYPPDALDGDFYHQNVSVSQQNYYGPRAGGIWPASINLIGPAGTNTYRATSTTSLGIVTGPATFITQAGLAYSVGARARATSNAIPTKWMEGLVTSYSATTLAISVDLIGGTGTAADWNINIAGNPGQIGPTGAGASYAGTSATSLTIGVGTKIFVTQTGLAYSAGARVRGASAGTPTDWMEGLCTGYSGGNLTVNVDTIGTVGTHADWNLGLSGQPGPQGPPGSTGAGTGDMLRANNLSDVLSATTARANIGAGTGSGDMLRANNLSDVLNAATARTNIGAGTGSGDMLNANNLAGLSNITTARANIGAGVGDMLNANNLSGLANTTTARANLGLGGLAVKTTALYGDIDSTAIATVVQFTAGTASKILNATNVWSAAALIGLGNLTGNITIDLNAGINFSFTLVGNATLMVPSNLATKVGQSGTIFFIQDATGNRTLSFASGWYGVGSVLPIIDLRANSWTFLSYQALSTAPALVIAGGSILP